MAFGRMENRSAGRAARLNLRDMLRLVTLIPRATAAAGGDGLLP
jgi:hypothetical protein